MPKERIFEVGDEIKSISELMENDWVILIDKPKHIEVIKSMTYRTIERFIKNGFIKKAIRKENK